MLLLTMTTGTASMNTTSISVTLPKALKGTLRRWQRATSPSDYVRD
jgi:hypothetical protein